MFAIMVEALSKERGMRSRQKAPREHEISVPFASTLQQFGSLEQIRSGPDWIGRIAPQQSRPQIKIVRF